MGMVHMPIIALMLLVKSIHWLIATVNKVDEVREFACKLLLGLKIRKKISPKCLIGWYTLKSCFGCQCFILFSVMKLKTFIITTLISFFLESKNHKSSVLISVRVSGSNMNIIRVDH